MMAPRYRTRTGGTLLEPLFSLQLLTHRPRYLFILLLLLVLLLSSSDRRGGGALALTTPVAGGLNLPGSGIALAWPLPDGSRVTINSGYGPSGGSGAHSGVNQPSSTNDYYALDFGAVGGSCGVAVRAAAAGQVKQAGSQGNCLGTYIYIDSPVAGSGTVITTLYAHLQSVAAGISRGSNVAQGQLIGYVGTTGCSSGCHLHFAAYTNAFYAANNQWAIGTATVPEPLCGAQDFAQSNPAWTVPAGCGSTTSSSGVSSTPSTSTSSGSSAPSGGGSCVDVYRTTDALNMRTQPTTSGSLVTTIPINTEVDDIEPGTTWNANGYVWRQLRYNSLTGYAANNWLTFVRTVCTTTTTTTSTTTSLTSSTSSSSTSSSSSSSTSTTSSTTGCVASNTCASLNAECGRPDDGCGVLLASCGVCGNGTNCGTPFRCLNGTGPPPSTATAGGASQETSGATTVTSVCVYVLGFCALAMVMR